MKTPESLRKLIICAYPDLHWEKAIHQAYLEAAISLPVYEQLCEHYGIKQEYL